MSLKYDADNELFLTQLIVAKNARIEALETALETIADTTKYLCEGEGIIGDLEKIARTALASGQTK